jgi:hypothetical protein
MEDRHKTLYDLRSNFRVLQAGLEDDLYTVLSYLSNNETPPSVDLLRLVHSARDIAKACDSLEEKAQAVYDELHTITVLTAGHARIIQVEGKRYCAVDYANLDVFQSLRLHMGVLELVAGTMTLEALADNLREVFPQVELAK